MHSVSSEYKQHTIEINSKARCNIINLVQVQATKVN